MMKRPKISIIGAGNVGSEIAHLLTVKALGDIVIINRTEGKAKGKALDLAESTPMLEADVIVRGTTEFEELKDSDIVVIASGAARKPGMQRHDLISLNTEVVANSVRKIVQYAPEAIMIVVTNPVDVMTYIAKVVSGFPRERVVGMSGALDMHRFRTFIASELRVSVRDVHALVIGSHGETMVPLPRLATVAGVPLTEWLPKKKIQELVEHTKRGGAELVELFGDASAHYAPAAAVVEMIESIVRDEKRILPCTVPLGGEYGVSGLCLGVPVKLGVNGVEEIKQFKLTSEEKTAFRKSAAYVKATLQEIGYLGSEKKGGKAKGKKRR